MTRIGESVPLTSAGRGNEASENTRIRKCAGDLILYLGVIISAAGMGIKFSTEKYGEGVGFVALFIATIYVFTKLQKPEEPKNQIRNNMELHAVVVL